jgi:peptide/nickel transport system substrate-binding protein
MATLVAAGAAVSLAACSSPAPEDTGPSTLTVVASVITDWNPAVNGDVSSYVDILPIQAVYDVLVNFNWDGSPIPSLAKSYELNEDRTLVTVELRDDVDFVDGEHLTAEGVAAWFDYLLSDESNYSFKETMKAVGLSFEATGEYELEIHADKTLFNPSYYMSTPLRLLFQTPILSPAVVDDPSLATQTPVGSGPYLLEDVVGGTEMTFVRNPDYWNPDRYPYDELVLKDLADPVAQLNALKSGQVDGTPLALNYVSEVEAAGLGYVSASRAASVLLIRDPFNSTLEPLRDERVRQAIAYSFDREAIVDAIGLGHGSASSQVFVEGQPEWVEDGDDRYAYDPEKARELLAEAGYPDGFEIVLPTTGGETLVPAITQALADIGITLTTTPTENWFADSLGGEYPVTLYENMAHRNTLRLMDEPFTGIGRFFDPNDDVADLLRTIRTGSDEDSTEASRELGEEFLEGAWYISIFHPEVFYAFNQDIVDVVDPVPFLYHFRKPEA